MKTALVIGGTGLVGNQLIDLLLNDNRYNLVKSFVRRPSSRIHNKLKEIIVDFDKPREWQSELKGDDLFSCLGTTIKTAGSKEAQYIVDYSYQYQTAKAASDNGVSNYVLVSSTGANPNSKVFYSRMKGELDRDVKLLAFNKIAIIKPSVLDGNRLEKRRAEKFAIILMGLSAKVLPFTRKYRPIHAEIVAKAMINAANVKLSGKVEYELEEVFHLAKEA
jgi:uncharacterized protein YbjT (DUF2867 family)